MSPQVDFKAIEQQRLLEIEKQKGERKRLELREKEKLETTLREIRGKF